MKNCIIKIPFVVLLIVAASCNSGTANGNTDSSNVPTTADTMPVLRPGNSDSEGVIETPPTNDNNAILPDSAIKNK